MSLTYQAAVEQTITAGEQIHQIVNGTATTEVTVEDGSKVPSVRKALLDNFYFKDPITWQVGQTENVFNQLRQFTDGSWWYAPSATASNPISMGSTPVGDPLWQIYDFDAIGKLTPQLREALRRSYAEAGYNVVGTFHAGFTIVNANDVGIDEATGKGFTGPVGPVAAGTNPASGGFVDVSGDLLRRSIHTTSTNSGDIHGILSYSNNAIVDSDIAVSARVAPSAGQSVVGAGGKINVTSPATPAIFINRPVNSEKATEISNLSIRGNVTADGDAAYGIFLRDTSRAVVDKVSASGFTGGTIAINTKSGVIRDIFVPNSVFHPSLVAGGYGVLLDEVREQLTDGIIFNAGGEAGGRHALYVSRSGVNGNAYDGCMNTISKSIIAKYNNVDDRNFWTVNIRKSIRGILDGVVSDGSNGGIAYNPTEGLVENHLTTNANMSVLKYADGVTVYGVSQLYVDENRCAGWLDTNLILKVKPKSGLTGSGCVGYSISGRHGMLSNVVTNVPSNGDPILIQPGARDVLINGVLDYIDENDSGTKNPLITFTGGAGTCSNIAVSGCKTSRPMFARLFAVTDLTVDFQRLATFSITSGVPTISNSDELIERIAVGSTSITIFLNPHVTQKASDTASLFEFGSFLGRARITQTSNKQIVVRFYDTAGVQLNPSVTSVSAKLVTYC